MDNVTYQAATPATPPDLTVISTEEVTTLNGGAVAAQQVQRVAAAVRTADGTAIDLPASTADGLLVNLGANNDVTITGSVAVTDGGGSLTIDGSVSVTGVIDTELPSAVALADDAANPTAPAVGAFNMVWDGVTWDRAPGNAADGALVNLGANNDVVVSATNLDIRDLSSATDSVAVTDGGGSLTVDGTIAATQSGSWIISANSGVDIGDVTINNAAGASAVNIQDGGNSITIDGSVSITGTVDTELPTAAALADNTANPTVPAVGAFGMIWDGATWDRSPGTAADGTTVNLGANNDVTVTGTVAATQSGTWVLGANSGVDIGDVTINNAAGASAVNIQDGGNTITVDGTVAVSGTVTTSETNATTGTRSSVNDVASDVQLLASNASRRVATIFNDSTEILYLALGAAAASLTDYTAQLFPRGYFETPYRYTGEIRGIWANNASGAARITELT